jgi:hypothetical protein
MSKNSPAGFKLVIARFYFTGIVLQTKGSPLLKLKNHTRKLQKLLLALNLGMHQAHLTKPQFRVQAFPHRTRKERHSLQVLSHSFPDAPLAKRAPCTPAHVLRVCSQSCQTHLALAEPVIEPLLLGFTYGLPKLLHSNRTSVASIQMI